MPIEEGISKGLDAISESGQLDRIVTGFSKLFSLDGSNINITISKIATALEKLPEGITAIKKTMTELWDTWAPKLLVIGKLMASIWVAEKVFAFGQAAVAVYKANTAATTAASAAQAVLDALQGPKGIALLAVAAAAGAATYLGRRNFWLGPHRDLTLL